MLDNKSLRPRPRPHDSKTTPATKGWRFALVPPWASRHIGGSRSIPTVHRCRKDGRPWAAQQHHNSTTRPRLTLHRKQFVKHLHGSGAGSLRPLIHNATTELDDRTRNQSYPRAETFRNQPRATGSPARDPACRQIHLTRDFFSTLSSVCTHHIVAQGVAARVS